MKMSASHRIGLGASQSAQEWPYGVDGIAPPAAKAGRHRSPQIIEECYEQALIVLRCSRDRLTGWRIPFWTGRRWRKTRHMPRSASAAITCKGS